MIYKDRKEAGQNLATVLLKYSQCKDAILLALPRGGVPVAYKIAQKLCLPLDVMIVRKLGVPGHNELAMGAIAMGGIEILNDDIIEGLHISHDMVKGVLDLELQELEARNTLYRSGKAFPQIEDKTVIIVDDGLATGATMHAAVNAVKKSHVGHVVIAVPVGSKEACKELCEVVDEVVCLKTPEPFYGVGQWYQDFAQVTDEEVKRILSNSN